MRINSRLPQSREEYTERYIQNNTQTGEGDQIVRRLPCLFCAAPDLILIRTLFAKEDLERGGTCTECGRGIIVRFLEAGNLMQYEVLQTVGDDPPDYLDAWPNRAS